MEAQKYTWLGKICSDMGEAVDIDSSNSYICESNVIRVAALEDTYISNKTKFPQDSVGIFLPQGGIEYFKVNVGDEIICKSGSVNIYSIL